jgi:hypothetical protein
MTTKPFVLDEDLAKLPLVARGSTLRGSDRGCLRAHVEPTRGGPVE